MVHEIDRQKLLCIVGPTASGKTRLAVELAGALSGEVVSCDSVQVYKYLDIGSAKPTGEEKRGIPHHMIDVASPRDNFSVSDYVGMAGSCIGDIAKRGRLPIVAGGTGLYFNSLIDPPGFSPAGADEGYRALLAKRAMEGENLRALLEKVDPASASRLHPNDQKRIIRALEVFHLTGRPLSEFHGNPSKSKYDPFIIGLDASDRDFLYRRIDRRVDDMMEQGLLREVERLYNAKMFSKTSGKAIGYNQLILYLEGKCSLEEAVALIKRETRRYAKRQLTWFRRDKRIKWFLADSVSFEEIVGNSLDFAKVFIGSVP